MPNLWDRERSLLLRPLFWVLLLLSYFYGVLCRIRIFMYRFGLLKTRRLEALVISVGNLTVGGTGKTPLVIALAETLQGLGLRVGILSRGYRGRRVRDLQWVSEGQQPLSPPSEVGDEPYLMARRLRDVPVLVGTDRFEAGREMLKRFKPDVILLDDAFQHLKLHRDVNLLVIDGTAPFGPSASGATLGSGASSVTGVSGGHLLPRGMLREPLEALGRASAVLVSRMEQSERYPEIARRIQSIHPGVPVFQVFFRPISLLHPVTGEDGELTVLNGRSVLAFSGIGRPGSFRFFLERLGAKVVREEVFVDHHPYSVRDVKRLLDQALKCGSDFLVTTEKDGVKVRELFGPDDPVWVLKIGLERIEDERNWKQFIRERVKVA